jgi:cytoskeleton protein RodZ
MMASFGARLKAAREERGVSLRQIAGATRISMTALEALEREDFSRLPGGIFSRAFIRAYAVEVGLDPEATVNEFVTELGRYEREAATEAVRPEVTAEDQAFLDRQRQATRIFRIVVVVVVVAVVVLGFWQGQRLLHEFSPKPVPPRVEPRASEPIAPVVPSGEASTAPEGSALLIEFSVTAECSVQVSTDGLLLFFKTMRSGERQSISAQREILLEVDNAGAVAWTINGKPAKPLGLPRERKRVTVTAANFADFLQ